MSLKHRIYDGGNYEPAHEIVASLHHGWSLFLMSRSAWARYNRRARIAARPSLIETYYGAGA